jgi:hypothetical protein
MTQDEIAAAVDANAALVGLPLADHHRAGVLRYFALAAEMAELVLAVPLGRDDESAAVFRPVAPPEAP